MYMDSVDIVDVIRSEIGKESIDAFRRRQKPKALIRVEAMVNKKPKELNVKTLQERIKDIQIQQDKAQEQYIKRIEDIGRRNIELMRNYELPNDVNKRKKITKLVDMIGVGKTGAEEIETIGNKHLYYARKYGIPLKSEGYNKSYDQILRDIDIFEKRNIQHIIKKGMDKKTKEFGLFLSEDMVSEYLKR